MRRSLLPPTLTVQERENEYLYKLPVAGYDPNCLNVKVNKNVVHLSGNCERKNDKAGTRSSANFAFSFTLPTDAKSMDISSTLDPRNEILCVKVGKEKQQPPDEKKSVTIP